MLDDFAAEGWIESAGAGWEVTLKGQEILVCLASQTRSFVESYEAVFHVVLAHAGEIERGAALSEAQDALLNARRLGLAGDSEAASDTSLANAIDWLVVHQILDRVKLGEKSVSSKQTPYEPGERWNELTELHQHLAKAAFAV